MMSRSSAVLSSTLAVLLGSTAAMADVTAEQVWEAWSKQYTAYGYSLSDEGTAREGDTLVVRGLSLTQETEDSSFDMTVPEVRLRELGDGTVEVTTSEEIKAQATSAIEEAPDVNLDMSIRQTGSVTIVSGTPEALSYAMTAPELVIELDQTQIGSEMNAPVKVWMSIQGTSGTYTVKGTETQEVDSTFRVSGVKVTASGADPESGGTFTMDAELSDLDVTSASFLPAGVSFEDLPAALSAGAKMSAQASYGVSSIAVEGTDGENSTKVNGTSQSGDFAFALAPETVTYSASALDQTFEMSSAQMPLPVSGAIASSSFDMAIPLAASDTPQPFNGKIALEGLSVSDDLWGMFDPQALLPRDPATLIIDLEGLAKPLVTLYTMDPGGPVAPPFELDSVKIKQLRLALAGAELTGTGDLSFPPTEGTPMPVGAIDLGLVGAKGLMDKLVTMGLVPQDQAMFAQMMLGLYAVPNGDDSMTSKIEFKDGGEILANGQRIQ